MATANNQNQTDLNVDAVETFLLDLVTQSPIVLRFTAADAAAYTGIATADMSAILQRYRDVQAGLTLSSAEFVIATFNRGRNAVWFILAWPTMTKAQYEIAGETLMHHEIMSVVREEVQPMLRNIRVQLAPAVIASNNRINRQMIAPCVTKLNNYLNMVMGFRQDVQRIRQPQLRRVAKTMDAVLDATIKDIQNCRDYLMAV